MELLCPICGDVLEKQDKRYVCEKNHSFDIARQGHVNLLPVQNKRSLNPGDTAQQVVSRREFLDGGFYAPIRDTLCALAKDHGCKGPILDVGCGTGIFLFYLASKGFSYLEGQELDADIFAVAKKNAGTFRTKVPDYAGHLEIRNENAVTAGVPDDIRICYLFNSFYDQNTYTEWLEALHESVRRTPRKVKVLLLYPTPSSLSAFRQCGWLRETRSIESRTENLPQFVRFQVFEN